MNRYYLAVDIGASSGRHILASMNNGKLCLEEIYRFENRMVIKNNHLCWDSTNLFDEILQGMKRCGEIGKIPESVGIDTWGVDFALLDENDELLGDTVAYRDARTTGMEEAVYQIIPALELYQRTGIQMQKFNTIYQLYAMRLQNDEALERAKSLLMLPEYFIFLLTGNKINEYTVATTSQLVNARAKTWDLDIIRRIGINPDMFGKIEMPGTVVGHLKPSIQKLVGFDCKLVLPAAHDTASAVLSVPATDDDYIFISSGTWSLIGVERFEPDCSAESLRHNFTNEGGFDFRFRYLKNIMGLWIIQSVRHELGSQYSFDDLCDLAQQSSYFHTIIDVNDDCFLSPENMTEAIKTHCEKHGKKVPETTGELMACVYNSLAKSYADAVQEIEQLTGRVYTRLNIVGGGTKDVYLNQLAAKYTDKEVYVGPVEATSIGNLLAQMLKNGEFENLEQARTVVATSFPIKKIGVDA
jgi:rhamnulokinase